MKAILASFVILLSLSARAELTIIDVRKNIPLSEDEPAYKDFYLAGDLAGLKKGLVVTAVRKITIRDSRGTQSYGDIAVPVGRLRVIAVSGKIAVAREHQLLSRDENPMLEQVGIMAGDEIDLKDSFIEDKPARKKTVSLPAVPSVSPEAVTTDLAVEVAKAAALDSRQVATTEIQISRPEITPYQRSEAGTSVYGAPPPPQQPTVTGEAPSATAPVMKKSPASLELEEFEEVPRDGEGGESPAKPAPKAPVFTPVDHLPTGNEE